MLSFAEFVAESFQSEFPLQWALVHHNRVTAKFSVDRIQVIVS